MAIDLLQSFLQKGNQVSRGQNSSIVQAAKEQQSNMASQEVLRAIKALKAGQTIQGEILSIKGDQVQLEVLKDVIIDARLSGALSLTPGSNMTFQVKGNQGGSLSLLPLFTNISADPNILKALDMAGIAVTERTTEMVQQMMERGMSINKQSLFEMYREIIGHKDSPVSDIVGLKHMNMAVTEDNLHQYQLYRNNEHMLSNTFSDMGKALGTQLFTLASQGKGDVALQLLHQIKNIFSGDVASQDNMKSQETQLSGGNHLLITEEGLLKSAKEQTVSDKVEILDIPGKESSLTDGNAATKSVEQVSAPWKQLMNFVSNNRISPRITSVFEKIWNNEVNKHWMLNLDELPVKEKVQELYEKVERHVKQLEGVLEEHSLSQTAAGKTVHTASANIDFMQQLNQLHAYVQIPMKMSHQNADGELYVFTNKKSFSREDGRVSALLHLDMEYLGKMDIYVALEDVKVSTQFYLEKEEYLDFIEEHMDTLTSRLQKRGYQCTVKATLRKEGDEGSVLKKIQDSAGGQVLLSTQAFDMRA